MREIKVSGEILANVERRLDVKTDLNEVEVDRIQKIWERIMWDRLLLFFFVLSIDSYSARFSNCIINNPMIIYVHTIIRKEFWINRWPVTNVSRLLYLSIEDSQTASFSSSRIFSWPFFLMDSLSTKSTSIFLYTDKWSILWPRQIYHLFRFVFFCFRCFIFSRSFLSVRCAF